MEEKRNKLLTIPLTEEEMEGVKAEASKLGISINGFIRLLIKNWADGITFEKIKVSNHNETH